VATRGFRGRDEIAVDLVGVAGLCAFLLGLSWLQTSEKLGFDPESAVDGVVSQLAVTLPAAILVLGATALELGTGLILARLLRRTPFDSLPEALLAAFAAAVLKDTLLLGTLGAFGLFQQPVLIAIDVVILAAGIWVPRARRWNRPLLRRRRWRESIGGVGSVTLAALVAIVWAGPIILQLASPVVPFVDVLPNYVGPVEHLRTFGWFSPLSATQSPIIGPSRTVLGYDGFLGALATLTNLPGGLAIAGFILPQTILVVAGAHRLASALRNGDAPVGAWALLAFALSQPFARLADARGTVVVVPLVCLGLAIAADALRRPDRAIDPDATQPHPWRFGRGVVIGLALGAAIFVHPVIGFFAVATVAIAALVRPTDLAPTAAVATLTAGVLALPQAATMAGLSLPTLALGATLPIAVMAGTAAGWLVERSTSIQWGLIRLAGVVRWIVLAVALVAAVAAFVIGAFHADRVPAALADGAALILESSGLLLAVLAIGIALGSRGARSPLVLVGLAVGIVATAIVGLLSANLGFLGDALRFEVPKTVHYWLSMIAAAGAATTLAHLCAQPRVPIVARTGALAAFAIIAALPLRPAPIDAYHLGEHRWSETFAIDLRSAGSGFWVGFPDSRTVVDPPRQELLDALRGEIEAGRLRHDTEVLHVARTFQQWVSTPLGVFDGIFETSISLAPETSHQTVGGRLFGSKDPAERLRILHEDLAGGAYGYVLLEPAGVPPEARDAIEAAGFVRIFENAQGTVFRSGG
jgi:hypothetical protein